MRVRQGDPLVGGDKMRGIVMGVQEEEGKVLWVREGTEHLYSHKILLQTRTQSTGQPHTSFLSPAVCQAWCWRLGGRAPQTL